MHVGLSVVSPIEVPPYPQEKKSALNKALERGWEESVLEIIQERQSSKDCFSLHEQWQIKVLQNIDFQDEEFLALNPEIKRSIYQTANSLVKVSLVARLNSLGMHSPETLIQNRDIISEYMDCALIEQSIFDFLIKLRREGRLFTEAERPPKSLCETHLKKYKFTRIQGEYRLESLIQKLELKCIKVPQKAVMLTDLCSEKISFRVNIHHQIEANCDDLHVYAPRISSSDRLISREEILELFAIIEASNFVDMWPENFIVAEDGIYFIDTEAKSFEGYIDWDKMKRFGGLVAEEDQEWFYQLIQAKASSVKTLNLTDCYQRYRDYRNEGRPTQRLKKILMEQKENVKLIKTMGFLKNDGRIFSFALDDILKH